MKKKNINKLEILRDLAKCAFVWLYVEASDIK